MLDFCFCLNKISGSYCTLHSQNGNKSQEKTLMQLKHLYGELGFYKLPGANVTVNSLKIHTVRALCMCSLARSNSNDMRGMCRKTICSISNRFTFVKILVAYLFLALNQISKIVSVSVHLLLKIIFQRVFHLHYKFLKEQNIISYFIIHFSNLPSPYQNI